MNKTRVGAVIVAAGESKRMGGLDKMLAPLAGKTVLARVLETFLNSPVISEIVLVVSSDVMNKGKKLTATLPKPVKVCPGGKRRQDSVAAGIRELDNCEWVIIHDGARPLMPAELIQQGLEAAKETGAAIAAVPVTDTIKLVNDNIIKQTLSRQHLWSAQTPQVFRYDLITEAYRNTDEDVTDDAMLLERSGHPVKLFMGSYRNIKITTREDLALAGVLLQKHD